MATNKAYWRKRIDETAQHRFDLTYEVMENETRKIYDTITREIAKEVEDMYYKLLDTDLSRTEIWTYKHYRDLANSINIRMIKLGAKEVKILNGNLEEALREIYTETILPKNTPIKPSFSELDDIMVQQIVARRWSTKHFTSTVWDNKNELVRILKKGITDSVVKGESKDKLVKVVMEKMKVGFDRADMVVRTELMHTINEGQRQKYMDHGYEEGIILVAHDERLCEKCVKYADNEKSRPIDEIVLPVHPRCRCTVIPVIDGYEEKSVSKNYESDIIKERRDKEEEIRQQIRTDVYPKNLNRGAQNKHIKTHNNYIEGRSYLTISLEEAQELVNKYAGTGRLELDRKMQFRKKELIILEHDIGVNINNITHEEVSTNRIYIHYGKNGTHIVPTMKGADEVEKSE